MTDDESLQQQRQGYWLRLARDRAGLTLAAAAVAAGMSQKSGGTVSRWEAGDREIKVVQLKRLARAYGVPISFLMRPEPTDEERLEEAIRSAEAGESADWERGPEPGPGADDEPGDEPGRRSA